MFSRSNKLQNNLLCSFLFTGILFGNYLKDIVLSPSKLHISYWSNFDTASLVISFLVILLLGTLAFSFLNRERQRELVPSYAFAFSLNMIFGLNIIFPLLILYFLNSEDFYDLISPIIKKINLVVLITIFLWLGFWASRAIITDYPYKIKAYQDNYSYKSQELKEKTKFWQKDTRLPKNIFVFLFDKLSYQELYLSSCKTDAEELCTSLVQSDKIKNRYSNFADFAQRAWNFHSVFSPYDHTKKSVPVITGKVDAPQESIMDFFKDSSYETHIMTGYLPYCDWFPHMDNCKSYQAFHWSPNRKLESFQRHLYHLLISGKGFYTGFFMPGFKVKQSLRRQEMVTAMTQDIDKLINKDLENKFIYLHFPIPHPPYVFNADGLKSKASLKKQVKAWSIDAKLPDELKLGLYRENLDFADQSFGKIIKKLKANKLFDDALIILTADHSYQHNPLFKNKDDASASKYLRKAQRDCKKQENCAGEHLGQLILDTHVPLIVKLPGQKIQKNNYNLISNSRLFSKSNKYLFDQKLSLNKWRINKLKEEDIFIKPRHTKKSEK